MISSLLIPITYASVERWSTCSQLLFPFCQCFVIGHAWQNKTKQKQWPGRDRVLKGSYLESAFRKVLFVVGGKGTTILLVLVQHRLSCECNRSVFGIPESLWMKSDGSRLWIIHHVVIQGYNSSLWQSLPVAAPLFVLLHLMHPPEFSPHK